MELEIKIVLSGHILFCLSIRTNLFVNPDIYYFVCQFEFRDIFYFVCQFRDIFYFGVHPMELESKIVLSGGLLIEFSNSN